MPSQPAFASVSTPPISAADAASSDSDDATNGNKNESESTTLESIEFPPPLSSMDRLKRAATFWSTAVPIVANYYGIIGKTKLQELMGQKLTDEEIEVREQIMELRCLARTVHCLNSLQFGLDV